jgi:hypothetical protein
MEVVEKRSTIRPSTAASRRTTFNLAKRKLRTHKTITIPTTTNPMARPIRRISLKGPISLRSACGSEKILEIFNGSFPQEKFWLA